MSSQRRFHADDLLPHLGLLRAEQALRIGCSEGTVDILRRELVARGVDVGAFAEQARARRRKRGRKFSSDQLAGLAHLTIEEQARRIGASRTTVIYLRKQIRESGS